MRTAKAPVKAPVKKSATAKAKPADKTPPNPRISTEARAFLIGKGERPTGHINTVALELLRAMDVLGNYSPDALYTSIMASGKEDADKVRHAVDLAIVQVRKDNGLQ